MTTPIRAVLLDLHRTLTDAGDPLAWLQAAWRHLGRGGEIRLADAVPPSDLAAVLDDVWRHAARVDPSAERDLDGDAHRRVFVETVSAVPGADPDLASALYATLPAALRAYDDAEPVLAALGRRGIRTALVSNIGFDVRPVLARDGLLPWLDAVVLSFEVGVKKPDRAIFDLALDRLGARAQEALMVGDSGPDDGGAAAAGIRTLLLPHTRGPVHGLAAVLDLVDRA